MPVENNRVGTRASLLVVDDDAFLLRSLTRTLRNVVRAHFCSSPFDALALLREHSFGILLTDIEMPGMRGYELVSRARALQPLLRVAFMSATVDRLPEEYGAFPLICKPFVPSDLRRVVAALSPAVRAERRTTSDLFVA